MTAQGRVQERGGISWRQALAAAVVLLGTGRAFAWDTFTKPTAEELSMKSLPGYPGAPAVVLFREQITKDDLHVVYHYDRIKILTEEGKKYANVELNYVSWLGNGETTYFDDKSIEDIEGRTIHPDGTIIPFTGKPYLKTMEKNGDAKVQKKVFTLPDVEVGSIIEYRYATRYADHAFESPDWFIQGELYVKSAHYDWVPTTKDLVDNDSRPINAISWYPILPPGVSVVRRETPAIGPMGVAGQVYDLVVKDIPPRDEEDYMPPLASFSYRVLFNFTSYRSAQEYWKSEGKHWSKEVDSFAGPNGNLSAATRDLVAGATTQDEKLRKIYATVMGLENTDFTRTHERQEDKAAGLGKVNNAADVLAHKRGGAGELTMLFVGMARAAGMKAQLMLVADRSDNLFTPSWQNMRQFAAMIAIVTVDGKEMFFDPGSRYCPYGKLAWEHTETQGMRQVDGGTDFVNAPIQLYTENKTARIADLKMDEHGEVKGTLTLTFSGAPALRWRQTALRGDEESLKHSLRTSLEETLPKSVEVKVTEIKNLEDYEKPLVVVYEAKGEIGRATGKRMVLPADVFVSDRAATFPQEKRQTAVYFHYPQTVQDAMRVKFPETMAVEALPEPAKMKMEHVGAAYSLSTTQAPGSVTTQRSFLFNEVLVPTAQYPQLRTFYSDFESKDKESVVLKVAPVQASVEKPAGN